MTSNTITTPKANRVMIFQINAHVDARMVVVQHTEISSMKIYFIFRSNLPVTKIKIQLINTIMDAHIPPKIFVCQKSIRILKSSVRKIT